jgi:hypothetical protein
LTEKGFAFTYNDRILDKPVFINEAGIHHGSSQFGPANQLNVLSNLVF